MHVDRKNHFGSLRLLLALLVLISHCWPLTRGSNASEPLRVLTRGQLTLGEAALDLFFTISGCLVLLSWQRAPQLRIFFWKRFCRIAPGYYAAAVVSGLLFAACFGPLPLQQYGLAVAQFDALNAPGSFPANPYPGLLNGPTWSIRYEVWAYVLIPFLGWLGAYQQRRWLIPLLLLLSLGLLVWQQSGRAPDSLYVGDFHILPVYFRGAWPRLLSCFLVGMLFALHQHRIPLNAQGALVALCALGVAALFPPSLSPTFVLAGSYLLFWVALHPSLRLPATVGADYSYGLYLYAFPVQQLWVAQIPGLGPLKLLLLSLPPAALCAWLSWRLVERPLLRLKERHQQV